MRRRQEESRENIPENPRKISLEKIRGSIDRKRVDVIIYILPLRKGRV